MNDPFGYALAMRVLQSDLYRKLDDIERGECDEMIARGMDRLRESDTPQAKKQIRRIAAALKP